MSHADKYVFLNLMQMVPIILRNFGVGGPDYTDAQVACFMLGYKGGEVKDTMGEMILRRAAKHIVDRHPGEFDPAFTHILPKGGTLH